MIALALVLLLQTQGLKSGTASDYAVAVGYQINGRVVVGLDEPVGSLIVTLKPIGDSGRVYGTQSFANGTFRFSDVTLGTYTVEVVDSRFNLFHDTILLRESVDTSKDIFIRLVRRGESGAPPAPDAALYTIGADTIARMPEKAVDEFNKGVDAIRNPSKKNPPDAHFKRAVGIAPEFFEAHMQLGLEQQQQNKKDDAIQSFEHAASIKPNEPRPLSLLGGLYLDAQRYPKVIETLAKVDQLARMTPRDHYNLGTALFRTERLTDAANQLVAAIDGGASSDPAPFLQLHNVLMKMRDGPHALQVLEDYLKLFPNDANHAAMVERAQQLRKAFKPPHGRDEI